MKLSKRGEYALRALIDLSVARELGRPLLPIRELSAKEKIPVFFIDNFLFDMFYVWFVGSVRGKQGGYTLARPAEEIRFGAIIRLIDGPLAPIRCVSQMAYAPCTCPDEAHCGLRMLMLDVRNAITRILDKYTLADVVAVTLRKLKQNKKASPFLVPVELSTLFSQAPLRPSSDDRLTSALRMEPLDSPCGSQKELGLTKPPAKSHLTFTQLLPGPNHR